MGAYQINTDINHIDKYNCIYLYTLYLFIYLFEWMKWENVDKW